METVRRRVSAILVLFLAALVAFSPMAKAAGSLEPSAPPGPVMKSLDEVEPRIPIKASNFPLTITQRGSYYLTQDVNFTDTAHHAITVGCNDVTIDLKGYTITGPNSTNYSGIYMYGRTNVEIRNGTVRDFYHGIYEAVATGRGHRVINIRAVSNNWNGIYLNSTGNLVQGCTAVDNSGYGISAGNGSTVTGNTASYNGSYGISASTGSTVTGNTASYNGNLGIYTNFGCTVTGNTASNNSGHGIYVYDGSTVTGNTASSNGSNGIYAEYGCTVTGNSAFSNIGDGISATSNSNITDNTCFGNGNGGNGAGIHVYGSNCRIEGNHVSYNDRGIDVDSYPNLIVKNSAVGNTTEYDIVANNKVGTISTDPTTANAWANFDF
jgi:parallel beta-helix repeat protein